MRPKGWRNLYKGQGLFLTKKTPISLRNGIMESAESVFEAGADAMEEGLKKQGLYGEIGEDYIISTKVKPDDPDWADSFYESVKGKGYLVFLSEEIPVAKFSTHTIFSEE